MPCSYYYCYTTFLFLLSLNRCLVLGWHRPLNKIGGHDALPISGLCKRHDIVPIFENSPMSFFRTMS
ncbi:hypothetical protein L2E82_39710 [Cichorium intybus]|uniref:Uncharacterized protein n=1 Tax=Cichorium intybus TaxID=13427 RepID=A0ACB9AJ23_CICIN|nr:hypothetical protein L2E82_39710 [Cichorium intybus]